MIDFFKRLDKYFTVKGLNDNQVTLQTGMSNGILGKARKRGSLSQDNISKLLNTYSELNANWLFTGSGEMIKKDYPPILKEEEPNISVFNPKSKEGVLQNQQVPLYDLSATASVLSIFNDTLHNIPMDHIHIPNLPKCDGAIYVKGDSMYPLLKSGDIVLFKNLNNAQNIIFGEMYVMYLDNDGDEFFFVKYIHKSNQDGKVKLVSQNQHHDDVEFPISAIKQLAIVKASVRINSSI